MALTPYANEEGLKYLFTLLSVTRPTTLFFAWHTGDPGDDGSQNEQVVGVDPDYARQIIVYGSPEWISAAKSSFCFNSNIVDIIPATGVSTTIYGMSVWDSLTGGNCLLAAKTTYPVEVSDVLPKSFIPGTIPVQLKTEENSGYTSYSAVLFLAWLLTADTVTRPVAWGLSLNTADPGEDGDLNELGTGDDPDYVRKATALDAPVSLAGSGTSVRNNIDSLWTAGAGSNYTAPYVVIHDALAVGIPLYKTWATPARIGLPGQTISVAAGEFSIKNLE